MYHPNSLKALEENRAKTQFCGESAVTAARKKHEKEAFFKSINEDLRERCTPELIAAINERLISLALNGNIKAYEMIRNGLGEDPAKKIEFAGKGDGVLEVRWMSEEEAKKANYVDCADSEEVKTKE